MHGVSFGHTGQSATVDCVLNPIVQFVTTSDLTTLLSNFRSKPVGNICEVVTEKSNEVTENSPDVVDGVDCSNTRQTVGCQAALQSD